MGPTILTLPSVLARIFAEAGRRLDDYLELVRIDPQWRSFFADGTTLDLRADIDEMSAGLDAFAPGTGAGYRRFMEHSARLHHVSDRFFFWRPVGGLRDMFNAQDHLRAVSVARPSRLATRAVGGRDGSLACARRACRPDARSFHAVCGLGSRRIARGTLRHRPHADQRGSLVSAGRHRGRAAGIDPTRDRAGRRDPDRQRECGASCSPATVASGESRRRRARRIPLDAVVSNSDAVRTHRELLGGKAATRFERRRRYEPACSGVVLYLGLDRRYDQLLHHNFVFSNNPEEEFEAIYRRGEPAPDPTCYVCAPARTEPGVAPPGGEALYVLVHTPYLRPHHDWDRLFPAYRKTILEKLSRTAGLTDIARPYSRRATADPCRHP